jgi:hypothetical protein
MFKSRHRDRDPIINQQAQAVASAALGQPVEAATIAEQRSTTVTKMYPTSGGEVWSRQVANGTGLPKTFILAVTRAEVYALEDKRHRGELAAGKVIKSWPRSALRVVLGSEPMARVAGVPDGQRSITVYLPIDADSSPVLQAIAQQRAAEGQRVPGHPHQFLVAKDEPSKRVLDALGAESIGRSPGGGPTIVIGERHQQNLAGLAGANITIGGQRLQDIMAQSSDAATAPPSTAARLQELESLRAAGILTDDEYARKRAHIIADI